jgi:hypothetical protein
MRNFRIWAPFRPLNEIKWQNIVYYPSITHKDEYFAKSTLELNENVKSSNILNSPPSF